MAYYDDIMPLDAGSKGKFFRTLILTVTIIDCWKCDNTFVRCHRKTFCFVESGDLGASSCNAVLHNEVDSFTSGKVTQPNDFTWYAILCMENAFRCWLWFGRFSDCNLALPFQCIQRLEWD